MEDEAQRRYAELIRDRRNGVLYPTGGSAELAERIDRLYGDGAQRTFSIARRTERVKAPPSCDSERRRN